MQKRLTIALDIDGTLIDKTGNLDPRVMSIFADAEFSMTRFILVTGGTYKSARLALQKINDSLSQDENAKNHGKQIRPYIATNSGGSIYAPDGRLIYDSYLDTDKVFELTIAARKADDCSVMIYVAEDTYFIESQDELKYSRVDRMVMNNALMHIFKGKESKKGEAGLTFGETKRLTSKESLERFATEHNGIQSLYVVPTSVSKEKKASVIGALKENAGDLSVYKGFAVEIPASTKKKAIQFILDNQINNIAYAESVSEVVYFGDGVNDVELLEACNVSVARGEQAKEVAVNAAKFVVNDCKEFTDDLYSGKFDALIRGDAVLEQTK